MEPTTGRSVIGRDAELADVYAHLGDASAGARALLVEGAPGIGKTTLWDCGVTFALDRGSIVLVSPSPDSGESQASFSTLADLLSEVPQGIVDALPSPQAHALRVATFRDDDDQHDVDARAISAGLLGVLRSLARDESVLIAIDDLQWVDRASAEALSSALRRLREERVRVMATLRMTEQASDRLRLEKALPADRVASVVLGPLSLDALDRILRERLGRSLLRPALRRVYASSAGNPLFALEMSKELLERHLRPPPGEPYPVPRNIDDVFRGRIDQLAPATTETLLYAASLRRPTVDLLERALPPGVDVVVALDEAVDADVVNVRGPMIRFQHPLLASAVYEAASRDERRAAHARLAEFVHDEEERARHLALSVVGADSSIADELDIAVRRTRSRGAPGSAVELAELAIQLTAPDDWDQLTRRQVALAKAKFAAGDVEGSVGLLDEVVAQMAPGPERGQAILDLGTIIFFTDARRARVHLDASRREPGIPSTMRAKAHTWAAWSCHYMGDHASSKNHARAAVRLAALSNEEDVLIDALIALALARATAGDGARTEEMLAALELQSRQDFDLVSDRADWTFACLLVDAGEISEGRATMEELLRLATDRGDERSMADSHWNLAECEYRAGRWQVAEQHMEACERIGIFLGNGSRAIATKAHLLAARGDLERARVAAHDAIAAGEATGERHLIIEGLTALGFIEVSGTDPAAGATPLRRAWELLIDSGLGEPARFPFVPDAAEALIAEGSIPDAEPMVEWLSERGITLDRPSAVATAARCRGLLAWARRDAAEAVRELRAALIAHDGDGMPFEHARSMLALGGVLRRSRKRGEARDLLEAASATFQQLGAPLWAAKANAELDRLGEGTRSGTLTPTEARVATLAAAGRTNKEIAGTMFLSVRTIEGHLSKTYSKLGVRSRTELAVFLAPGDSR